MVDAQLYEDWDHLLNNLSGYFSAYTVLVVLYGTLFVLGYDFRRLIKMSAVVHAFAFVVAPLFSAFARLALAGFVPQAASSKVLGFSTSVSAYVGADIALWAIAAEEALNARAALRSLSPSSSAGRAATPSPETRSSTARGNAAKAKHLKTLERRASGEQALTPPRCAPQQLRGIACGGASL